MKDCDHDFELLSVEDERHITVRCKSCGRVEKYVEFLGLEMGDIKEARK